MAGYSVTVGIEENKEIDFIAQRKGEKLYVQVAYLLSMEQTIAREFGNLLAVQDNFPKYVVTMDQTAETSSFKGIERIHIKDFCLTRSEMESLGSQLGADIPFTISGGTAIGTGRGDQITPVLSRGSYNWVLALSSSGLSTPAVYGECDRLREGLQVAPPHISDVLMHALSAGDAIALGKALSNDLQPAACSLKPALRLILDVGIDYGALGGLVSGSGPTVAFLAENEDHALDLVVALTSSGVVGNVVRTAGPVPGARVIESA